MEFKIVILLVIHLYRHPEGNTDDWLFGRWSGNNVGWIKHMACTTCPEHCSRMWVYWDPTRTTWYRDYSVRITVEDSEDHCFTGGIYGSSGGSHGTLPWYICITLSLAPYLIYSMYNSRLSFF